MINSLSKDSHIIHGTCYSAQSTTQAGVRKKSGISTTAYNSEIKNKPAKQSFCGFFNADKFYKSKALKSTLKFADDQQLVFGAAFSLFLTCVMRPASIMLFPSKKNKEDQKYASAHSIASGVIGFAISTAIFTPISSGIKKFTSAPVEYLKDKSSYLLKDEKALNTAKIYLDRMADITTAVPKGLLTIALIPPIMKYVFGIEKNKQVAGKKGPGGLDYSLLNFSAVKKTANSAFSGFSKGVS